MMKPRQPFGGFLRRRFCLVPTWQGWCLLFLTATALATIVIRNLYPFLAIHAPVPDGILVVEGWVPDYALEAAIVEFHRHQYRKLYVTGGPLYQGAPLSEYKTHAELGAATVVRLGLSSDDVQPVPAPAMRQDRTYASAVALRNWLHQHGARPTNFNVITMGAHARRTRLLFEKAFGGGSRVGIVLVEDRDYDAQRWWKSSQGVKSVVGEMIAYTYARCLFHPDHDP
jgi:hypothetical protein